MSHLGKDDIINLCSVSKTWHRRLAQKRNIWTNLIRMRYECDTPENCDAMKFYLKPFGNLYYTDILEKTFTSNFSGPMAKIRSVSVAACHSACLTINGDLYIWGKDRLNEYGADVKYIRSPRLIMSNVKDVKCVDIPGIFLAYTVILNTSGELYLVGKMHENDKNRIEPEKYLDDVLAIVSAESNIVVLLFDGTYYSTDSFTEENRCIMNSSMGSDFHKVCLNYNGHDMTNNVKDIRIKCCDGYYVLTSDKLVHTRNSNITLVDDNVTMFHTADVEGQEMLFVTKKSMLYSFDVDNMKAEFELDSKIVKIRLNNPEGDIWSLYVLTENGTLYVHRYVDDFVIPNTENCEKIGLIIKVDACRFATSPIPIFKKVYDFDISESILALITDQIHPYEIKPS